MKEYILYVILIFIPIGSLMVYLLRKDGLPGKYINIILILSLFIILSFPICMERLGRPASVLIYILVLAALCMYLLKARIGAFTMSIAPELAASSQPDAINIALLESAETVTEGTNTDITLSLITNQTCSETGEIVSGEISPELLLEVVEEEPSAADEAVPDLDDQQMALEADNEQIQLQFSESVSHIIPDEIPKVQDEPAAGTEAIELIQEVEGERVTEIMDEQSTHEVPEDIPQSAPFAQEPITTHLMSEKQESTAEIIEPVISESIQKNEALESEMQDEPAQLVAASGAITETVFVDLPGQGIAETNIDEEKVNSLIDAAFACRSTDADEAARNFEEAWQLTSDYELKYLLTVELVEIYKDSGCYNEAVSILHSFIVLPNHKSDIINEISRQFDYVSLLAAELERLGIGDLPVSRVPRWVRLKVDAELNPPGV